MMGIRFWEADPVQRPVEFFRFLCNASILGGLVIAALDTGGRPSAFWAGRNLAGELVQSVSSSASSAKDRLAIQR